MNLVGKPAPDFELEGYPLDFTFVCPTEVLNFSGEIDELSQLNCEIFGISVDSQYVHKAWVDTKREDGGLGGTLNYPLLSDINKQTARDYDILLEEEGVALRGLFLVNPDGIIMHTTINNLSVGRSVNEAKRVLKAFQFVTSHEGHVCPADWEEGKDTMVAESEEMKKYLSSH
jgi:peroxiredoxin (alkyl hydroperoxide reductase subunit C)